MQVFFIQGFVNEIKVMYTEVDSESKELKKGGFTLDGNFSAEMVIEKLNSAIDESKINNVLLWGKTGVLKDLEEYYGKLKEVSIEWQ